MDATANHYYQRYPQPNKPTKPYIAPILKYNKQTYSAAFKTGNISAVDDKSCTYNAAFGANTQQTTNQSKGQSKVMLVLAGEVPEHIAIEAKWMKRTEDDPVSKLRARTKQQASEIDGSSFMQFLFSSSAKTWTAARRATPTWSLPTSAERPRLSTISLLHAPECTTMHAFSRL